ncbi:MAG: SUMF1/EgtB/PvdO family nonheme iron enzyme [Armatimonadetes bacterium]|nr:SUMF1/EgtB/PvdO family nonheme iron enzyme [Armatimonadota bacterium]
MGDCSRFDQLLNASEGELSEQDQAALLEYARSCPDCAARLRDLARAAHLLSSHEAREPQSAIHATDMELAVFAAHGLHGPNADAAVEHLASCPVCRRELAAVRLAIEHVEDVTGESANPGGRASRAGLRHTLSLAFSTPRRATASIGAALTYAGMCLCFGSGLAHLLLAYVITGRGSGWASHWWPFSLMPGGSLRLWTFVVLSAAFGLGLRRLALLLWHLGAHGAPSTTQGPETGSRRARVLWLLFLLICVGAIAAWILLAQRPWEHAGERAGEEIQGPDGAPMVWVPADTFLMGVTPPQARQVLQVLGCDPEYAATLQPAKRVTLSRGFWMHKFEVSRGLYRKYCEATGAPFPTERTDPDEHPIVYVSWQDAFAYCTHFGMRLPTEAQWELSARSPDGLLFPWGDEWDVMRCCNYHHRGPEGKTMPVDSLPEGRSWCGAHHLVGNVWEFCEDWYTPDYLKILPDVDPRGALSGTLRTCKGGAWFHFPDNPFGAGRGSLDPKARSSFHGFRGVIVPQQ